MACGCELCWQGALRDWLWRSFEGGGGLMDCEAAAVPSVSCACFCTKEKDLTEKHDQVCRRLVLTRDAGLVTRVCGVSACRGST